MVFGIYYVLGVFVGFVGVVIDVGVDMGGIDEGDCFDVGMVVDYVGYVWIVMYYV